jgi:hypothetical protein
MKKTIEIECPEGYNPVYKDGTIQIRKEFKVSDIDSVSNAIMELSVEEIKRNTIQGQALLNLMHIISALNKRCNNGNELYFNEDIVYYPYLNFYTKKKEDSIKFRCNNEIYYLVSGRATNSPTAGIGNFSCLNSVGVSYADASILGCATREIAEYVSKTFPKLIFDALYYGKIDYEWID